MSPTKLMLRGSATMARICNKKLESTRSHRNPHGVARIAKAEDGLACGGFASGDVPAISSFSIRHSTQPMMTSGARRIIAVLKTGRSRHGHSQWIKPGKPLRGACLRITPTEKAIPSARTTAACRDVLSLAVDCGSLAKFASSVSGLCGTGFRYFFLPRIPPRFPRGLPLPPGTRPLS